MYTEKIQNDIIIIWFNNPPVNAITFEFLNQLNKILDYINNDKNIRCLLIGSKANHFCAGADLKERIKFNKSETLKFISFINNTYNRIEDLNIPVIAMLNGATLGGGAELSLCADFRLADKSLQIGFPETSLGIIPGAGGTYRLPKVIGIQKAKCIIFTAQNLNYKKAMEINLIDEISNDLISDSITFAKLILKNSPIGLKYSKISINDSFYKDRSTGLKIENKNYKNILGTKDRLEALKAFNDKRKPIWQNK